MRRAFVTGATGVLGRATVPLLLRRGYAVAALSRSDASDAAIRALGAEPIRADLFDRASLTGALRGTEAVLHLATRIAPPAQARKRAAWAENDRIRAEGTRNLVAAAVETGTQVVVYPSVTFVYADGGDAWLDAASARLDPVALLRSTLAAEAEVERFAESGNGRRGVSLRLGLLYGPDAPSTAALLGLAAKGLSSFAGSPDAFASLLWVEDAAAALVAALERAPSGVFDVVDDEPLRHRDLDAAMAARVGRRRLRAAPAPLVRLATGDASALVVRSQRVSNRRFKEATGWQPAVPSARVGLERLAVAGRAVPSPRRTAVRAATALLAAATLAVGAWQVGAPRSFNDAFPGLGHAWVSVDGPYNEHLLRDAGGGNLAIGVVALAALLRPTPLMARTLGVAALAAGIPHLAYHLIHVALIPGHGDQLAQTPSLLATVLVPAFILFEAGALDNADAAGERPWPDPFASAVPSTGSPTAGAD